VPRALRKMLGGGVIEESWVDHWEVSVDTRGWSFGLVLAGSRRESECTLVIEG
jgi:hypothetical protein